MVSLMSLSSYSILTRNPALEQTILSRGISWASFWGQNSHLFCLWSGDTGSQLFQVFSIKFLKMIVLSIGPQLCLALIFVDSQLNFPWGVLEKICLVPQLASLLALLNLLSTQMHALSLPTTFWFINMRYSLLMILWWSFVYIHTTHKHQYTVCDFK